MSSDGQILVQLDPVDEATARRRAHDVRSWLLESGVVVTQQPNRWTGADLARGPSWRSVVDDSMGVDTTADVDVGSEVRHVTAMENFEPWTCPRCGAELEDADLVGLWAESLREPVARCAACDFVAPLGDWPAEFPTVLVGAPVVTFYDWFPLRREFVAELAGQMGGGRVRYFWSRW